MQEQKVQTEFGLLWTACSEPSNATAANSNPTILCFHGNAIDSRLFEPLLDSNELKDNYRLIVFDFAGHGRSEKAPDPEKAYFQHAYAQAGLRVLQHYKVKTVVALGWSMGGQVAMELPAILATPMNDTNIKMVGAVITGAVPVRRQKIVGFRQDTDISALFNPDATEDDLKKVASVLTTQRPPPAWLVDSLIHTDRAAGRNMVVKFMEGHCSDQVEIVHDSQIGSVAFIYGSDENLVDMDFLDEVVKGAPGLWRGEVVRLPGLQHGSIYDDPNAYRKVLLEYLKDLPASN